MNRNSPSVDCENGEKTLTLKEKEELEKLIKIQELQQVALKNPRRKISADSARVAEKNWQKYTRACVVTTQFMKNTTSRKNIQENTTGRSRSKSVLIGSSNQVSDQEIDSRQWPKLPGINGRMRSATVGFPVDLQKSVVDHGMKYDKAKNDDDQNKSDSDADDVEYCKKHPHSASHINHDQRVEKRFRKISSGTVDEITQSSSDDVRVRLHDLKTSQSSSSENGYLWKRRPTNISPPGHDEQMDSSHVITKTVESLPAVANFEDKVRSFLIKSQPSASPQSLKLPKNDFDVSIKQTRKTKDHLPRIKISATSTMSQLNSNLYLNPFHRVDGKSWYYNDKTEKCRYLRVPPTPELTVEEIFQKDTLDDEI